MRKKEMDCQEIQELLTAYLDGEVTPEEKAYIEAHLADCSACRAELEAFSSIQRDLRSALTSIAEDAAPSLQVWEKIKDRLEAKESRRGFWSNFTFGRVTAAATAVVVLAIAIAVWQFGGFFGGMSSPPPAPISAPAPIEVPTTTPATPAAPEPTPAPEPTMPEIVIPDIVVPDIEVPEPSPFKVFEANVAPEEAYYLPGETIKVELSLSNVSSEPITVEPYPADVQVTSTPERVWYVTPDSGSMSEVLFPGDEVSLVFTWDQQDQEGNQVPSGWYNITFKDISITQGDSRYSINPTARVLIEYPQGAMEKTIELNESRTVNSITFTLERIELTATGMKVYAFNTPPDYNLPSGQPGPAPSLWLHAEAEYSFDGEVFKQTFPSGIRFLENGVQHTWGEYLDPAPKNAEEVTFRITKLGDWEGPWEFTVALQ